MSNSSEPTILAADQDLALRFWGVRGSTPVSGPQYAEFGGSTPCIEVRCGQRMFIVDAGSGIYNLWQGHRTDLPQEVDLLFSHLHLDHTAGLPFFKPAVLDPDRVINTYCGNLGGESAGPTLDRLFAPPPGQTPSSMREAANFLNSLVEGKTLSELQRSIAQTIAERRQEIDLLAQQLVESGLALWTGDDENSERLIVRGRSHLLGIDAAEEDLARIRSLFDDLERKRDIAEFLELAEGGDGVRIFIGSENKLFSLSGSSLVVSPYMNADRKVIGAVGVIGPTRLNYGRIVPIVNYTAQLVGKLVSDRS